MLSSALDTVSRAEDIAAASRCWRPCWFRGLEALACRLLLLVPDVHRPAPRDVAVSTAERVIRLVSSSPALLTRAARKERHDS